jgi:hypothetical protein
MEQVDRRTFFGRAAGLAVGGLTAGVGLEIMRPGYAWAQQAAGVTHAPTARVLQRLHTGYMFQISCDVPTIDLGLSVAAAALVGGVNIIEMGTPLLKNQGFANVVPAFRKRFPDGLLLADMKTMDGGAFRGARGLRRRRQHRRFPGARRCAHRENHLRCARRVPKSRRRPRSARLL